ncbi:MAG: hypothetical protein ACJAWL_002715 [Motiliproteus sp.]|jgi:hypothetical protein
MTTPVYPHAQLVVHFESLIGSLAELADRLRASTLPLWVPLTEQEQAANLDPRHKAIELYCDLWHQDGGDGRRTRSCHGLIAADAALLAAADRVNQAKADFRLTLAMLKTELNTEPKVALESLGRRPNALREVLGYKGLARLHLKQCYRLIPSIERQPQRVGLNWYTSGRSIKRLSVDQAQKLLLRIGIDKPHIQVQMDKLQHLSGDCPLAQIQQQAPLMRANLRYENSAERQAMNLSLPLLFGYDAERPFPEHNSPSLTPETERQRQIRSDCRIDPEPFLPSLRIHLYL